jgi:antitoxin component YwqK of YwqJK toxin-antitoxin module
VERGEATDWYENGVKMLHRQGNGEHVEETAWYEDGQKAGEVVQDGRRKKITRYHKNGQVAEVLEWDGGEKPQLARRWDESGRLIEDKAAPDQQ